VKARDAKEAMKCPHGIDPTGQRTCRKCMRIVDAVTPKSKAIALELEKLLPKKTHGRQRQLVGDLCQMICLELSAYYDHRHAQSLEAISQSLESALRPHKASS
jgi:hypothetical protein